MSIVRIISFTENGYQLSCKMQDCLQERAEVVLYSGKNQVFRMFSHIRYPLGVTIAPLISFVWELPINTVVNMSTFAFRSSPSV